MTEQPQDPNVQPDPPAGGIAVYYVAACTFCSPTQGTVHYDYWTEDEAAAEQWAIDHVTLNPAHHVPITKHVIDYQPAAPAPVKVMPAAEPHAVGWTNPLTDMES